MRSWVWLVLFLVLTGCPGYTYLDTGLEGNEEVGSVRLVNGLVEVKFNYADEMVFFYNNSDEYLYIVVRDVEGDIDIADTPVLSWAWWTDGVVAMESNFEHGMLVEVVVYDVVEVNPFSVGQERDYAIFYL